MYVYVEKKNFSRTSRPISIKLGTNYSWVKGILNCSNFKSQVLFKEENNYKNAKMGRGSFKNLLKNNRARRAHIYMKGF
jgi:hypothetical protein